MTWFPQCRVLHKRQIIIRDMTNLPNPIGSGLQEEFFDGGKEELLTCCDIMDQIALHDKTHITITFDKAFLKKILHSHITYIRSR